MDAAFTQVTFQQPARAVENLRLLHEQLPASVHDALPRLLANLPDPDSALNNLERVATAAGRDVLDYLALKPAALYHLLALFAYSQYLSDMLIHQPGLIVWLEEEPALYRVKTTEEMLAGLAEFMLAPGAAGTDLSSGLARFKRREYLRIALRDVLRLATLGEITLELSSLADAILQYAVELARAEMTERYGTPMLPNGNSPAAGECPAAILSLGKLGGNELNYSSDIDLIFLYRANGETTAGISNKEYFVKVAHRVVGLLTAFGPEGSVFRVDLRLRPEGREGDMAVSLEGAREYYRSRARDWELQALIKARHSAGDPALTRDFLDSVQARIYSTSVDFSAIDSMLFSRQRIAEALKRRSSQRLGVDVKLEHGGIRDIEFLAQCLQRLYGGQNPWVRSGGTMFALQKLADKGYLRQSDYGRLTRAYIFLRKIEHLLQLERGQQTHRLPGSPDALGVLARRARVASRHASAEYGGDLAEAASSSAPDDVHRAGGELVDEVARQMKQVREVYERLLRARGAGEDGARAFSLETEPFAASPSASYPDLLRYLESNCPPLYRAITEMPVSRGRKTLQRFLLSAYTSRDDFQFLCDQPDVLERAAPIFEYSPFLSELLVRHPSELAEVAELPPPGELLAVEEQKRIPAEAPYAVEDDAVLMHIAQSGAHLSEKMALMRRHYRRRLLRIHAHSLLGPVPVFSTLEATSVLAEQVLRAAYRAAVTEAERTLHRPAGDLIVVALGRLGVREFDIASDADLGFLYHGGDPDAKQFWTRVAERLLEIISAYTSEGTLFAIDTRLRPRGREGELVEGEPALVEYFHSAAQPWEALAYMKSRVVAGDIEEGTVLLLRIQNTIGARFGRGADAAKKLADMRKRLEAGGAASSFLKTAPGGYYDIDFILTYLRLQAAQVFFPSLTTIERLRVVEWMGQLDAAQAQTLREAAIFLRGVEHALRVSTGRSDCELPPPGPRLEALEQLAARWLPESLRRKSLPENLDSVMKRVRRIFSEIFKG